MAEYVEVFDNNLDNEPIFVEPALLQGALLRCRAQLEKDPSNLAVLRSQAELYRKLGRLTDAAGAYARICEVDPQDSDAAYLRALMAGDPLPPPAKGIRPAPFIMIRNFLPPDFHQSLVP